MAHFNLNKPAHPSLAEKIGFLIYRLSQPFRNHRLTTTPESADALATPYEERPPGLFYHVMNNLISLFNKLVDLTLKVVEPIYPSITEYPAKGIPSRIVIVDKLKNVLNKLIKPLLDLTESIYLSLFHTYRIEQQRILTRVIEAIIKNSKKILILVVIITGCLLARGVILVSPRHIVIFTLLPICVAIIAMKPIYGLILYLFLSIGAIQGSIWNFPASIFGVPLFLSTTILLATMLSWLIDMVKKREKFRVIYDSNNSLIIGFWGFLTLSFLFATTDYFLENPWGGGRMYDYLPFANWFVVFFVIIYIIGDDKKRFFSLLYTIAGIHGYFAYKVIRRASYFGFGTDYTVTAGLSGQLGDNNELAACLVMAIPIFYALFLCEKTKTRKAIFLIAFMMPIVAVIYTRSRGGLLGLAVLSIPLFFKLMLSTARNKIPPIIFAVILVASGYGLFREKVNQRIESIKNWQQDSSAQNRIISVIVAWEMVKDSPIVGQGMNAYGKFLEFCPEEMVIKTGFDDDNLLVLSHPGGRFVIHNAYASLVARFGLPCLIFFVWLIFHSLKKLRRLRKQLPFNSETDWIHYLSHALGLSILAYTVTAMFLNNAHLGFIYVVYAMTSSLCYITLKPTRKHNLGISLLGLILFGCWLYYTIGYRA